jgi:hypothetical protein
MIKTLTLIAATAVSLLALNSTAIAQDAAAESAKHAINTKGTGATKVSVFSSSGEGMDISGKFKWVTRTSYNTCPGGSVQYVASDGGAACAVEIK